MAAYAKGAPVRIIGAEATGAADYWYAKASSPIKTLQDTNGQHHRFSTNGSSTQSIVRAFIDEFKLTAKPMATGNPSATLTAVMTDQVDVGWASPPFGLKEQEAGQIRVVAKATDAALVRGQTIRVIVANAQALEKRKDAIDRFMDAYRETIDYMYRDNPQVIKDYADFVQVPERRPSACATSSSPRAWSIPTRSRGSTALVKEAVNLKFISEPLTAEAARRAHPDPAAEEVTGAAPARTSGLRVPRRMRPRLKSRSSRASTDGTAPPAPPAARTDPAHGGGAGSVSSTLRFGASP